MGLTLDFFKKRKHLSDLSEDKSSEDNLIILAGNPNVGKSTLFNYLTGMKQHTGNWSGKTVGTAFGTHIRNGRKYTIADIPGTYSLKAESAEEACAAEVIRNKNAKCVMVVCDATSLERNLNLVLQICELCDKVIVAINFADAAAKKGIHIDINSLSKELKSPVTIINARKKQGIDTLFAFVENNSFCKRSFKTDYGTNIEYGVKIISKSLKSIIPSNHRYFSLRILENDEIAWDYVRECAKNNPHKLSQLYDARHRAMNILFEKGLSEDDVKDIIAITLLRSAHRIAKYTVSVNKKRNTSLFSKWDKILTGKISGAVFMLLLLCVVFFITLSGANYLSDFMSTFLFLPEKYLLSFFNMLHFPNFISNALVFGGYRVLAWVVSVMLPPMAIFFPLFTILEDVGYLPRVAFNLDKCFKKCRACGKQALTSCMAFGCNAAGVTGARIIDSPREKLIAILTNSFIPCNGRFPSLITLISIYFTSQKFYGSILSSLYLSLFIALSVAFSLIASRLLSSTLLKGMSASFALELPPYRKPQFGKIIVRSVLDRTITVLLRAVVVAFPAGIILYVFSNLTFGGTSVIKHISNFLNPPGKLMGLDGVMLTAFIFGIPANEIVLPIALMIYSSGGILSQMCGYNELLNILSANGWTISTALCSIIFIMFHWPCSTTLMTIKKETGSFKWTAVALLLPTLFGVVICMLINLISKIII